MLKAYRWQYIVSGVMEPRFQKVLFALVDDAQGARIQAALAPLMLRRAAAAAKCRCRWRPEPRAPPLGGAPSPSKNKP